MPGGRSGSSGIPVRGRSQVLGGRREDLLEAGEGREDGRLAVVCPDHEYVATREPSHEGQRGNPASLALQAEGDTASLDPEVSGECGRTTAGSHGSASGLAEDPPPSLLNRLLDFCLEVPASPVRRVVHGHISKSRSAPRGAWPAKCNSDWNNATVILPIMQLCANRVGRLCYQHGGTPRTEDPGGDPAVANGHYGAEGPVDDRVGDAGWRRALDTL